MKLYTIPAHNRSRVRFRVRFLFPIALITFFSFASMMSVLLASSPGARDDRAGNQRFQTAAADNCANATVINPASLPFTEDSTTVGATNDIDPGFGSCAQGPGPDVVYSFTPAATDTYTIGATPIGEGFDVSLYVVTDCANPAGTCVGGTFQRALAKGEALTLSLIAGTRYFIVVDSPSTSGAGLFHLAVRRGLPPNDSCATPTIIDPSRLPFTTTGSTIGATNDSSLGQPCIRATDSTTGPDVVYQFTSPDSQNYDITVTPVANFDPSVYIVTNCTTLSNCTGADFGGNGDPETLRRNLTAGTTYFIIVDGVRVDAGDFTISIVPTIPRSPNAPTNLVARAVSSSQIDLTWEDNANNELGFRVERSLDGSNFTQIAELGPNVTAYSDTGLQPATTYFYRVFAFNNFGNSDASNIAADTTQGNPIPQFPVITVTPTILDFGSVRSATIATRTVNIKNDGGTDLVITAISNPAAPFSIANKPTLPLTIQPGQSVDITVQFQPPTQGQFAGTFTITSNAPLTPDVVVSLSGTGVGFPVANLEIVTASNFIFPNGSSVSPVEIKNTGDADLLISSMILPTAPFSITGLPARPITIKPGESIIVNLSFSPSAPGVFQSTWTIINNDPDILFLVIQLRGTSTPQSEIMKLRAPAQFTAVLGQSNTINIQAVNGTNSDIRLSASSFAGGTFTDRGNGRGDLVFTRSGTTRTTAQVLFTATDSQNRTKSLVTAITLVPPAETLRVQVSWTAPETAPGPPTGTLAINRSFPLIASAGIETQADGFNPAVAAGLVAYVVYRSNVPGEAPSLGNIVGVVPATSTTFNDLIPTPATGAAVMPSVFYTVTALYQTGAESNASNESSDEPRLVGLQFKKKRIRFQAANSNVETGAVLVVDGTQTFALTLNGEFIEVSKSTRSTPGNLRPVDIFTEGSSHTVQVRNPHGPNSRVITLTR